VRNRILCIEDDPAVAKGLRYGISDEGFEFLHAADGETGLKLIETREPDLVVLDIRLPDIDGFELCRRVRGAGNSVPILMLTARDAEIDKVLGLELGADDYLVKPYSFRELLSRIRALLRRAYGDLSSTGSGPAVKFGSIRLQREQMKAFREDQDIYLTPIEFRLLRYLVDHPNRPFTRAELLRHLKGTDAYYGDERAIDVHVRHLRTKLEDDPARPRWIQTVRGFGYKFAGEESKIVKKA